MKAMQRTEIGSNLNTGFATHAGMTGKHNEDFFGLFAWKIDDQRDLYLGIVADGVGGQTAGEVASHLTVNTIQKYFDQQESIDDINYHLERSILIANRAVYQASQENPEYQGMSTTVAMAAILEGRFYTAHVGDSRIYLLRDGNLQQLSVDHTWAQEAIEAGLLTPQQAKTHPNRNVIRRHLGGGSNIEVDHRMALQIEGSVAISEANQGTSLRPGDTLLLCSDGLSDMISDEAILESLQGHFQDLPAASQELVDKANQAGGKDNITIVLLQMPGKGAPVAAIGPAGVTAVAAGKSATATPSIAATSPKAPAAPVAKSGMGKSTWLLVGVAGLLLLIFIAAGLIFVINNSFRDESTPAATATTVSVSPDETLPAGAPATAAILATAESATGTADSSSPIETPGLIPTLRSTTTPTRIRTATRTATSPPPATAIATSGTSSDGSGNSSGGSGGSDPDTPEPPTSEPPATDPPVPDPSEEEPPASDPPDEEPPASDPPDGEPPAPDPSEEEPPASKQADVEPSN